MMNIIVNIIIITIIIIIIIIVIIIIIFIMMMMIMIMMIIINIIIIIIIVVVVVTLWCCAVIQWNKSMLVSVGSTPAVDWNKIFQFLHSSQSTRVQCLSCCLRVPGTARTESGIASLI